MFRPQSRSYRYIDFRSITGEDSLYINGNAYNMYTKDAYFSYNKVHGFFNWKQLKQLSGKPLNLDKNSILVGNSNFSFDPQSLSLSIYLSLSPLVPLGGTVTEALQLAPRDYFGEEFLGRFRDQNRTLGKSKVISGIILLFPC